MNPEPIALHWLKGLLEDWRPLIGGWLAWRYDRFGCFLFGHVGDGDAGDSGICERCGAFLGLGPDV